MAEALHIPLTTDRAEIYTALVPQIEAVVSSCDDLIANLANISAILKQAFDYHWVGFYCTKQPKTLVLGPFQGPLACVTIPFSKGVCGYAATTQKTALVPDVELFPGHIACSSLSRSEIVVPLVQNGETKLVLDIDSAVVNDFTTVDQEYLETIIGIIKAHHFPDGVG